MPEEPIIDTPIWDYLPLYSSLHEYGKIGENEYARIGDYTLIFRFSCDDGFTESNWYVDPLDLESKESYIDVMIYRCNANSNKYSSYDIYWSHVEWLKK